MRIDKVFISGPMAGYPNNNREEFMNAEKLLRDAGFSVFNPARLDFDGAWTRADIMSIDLNALSRCNYIYQLDGWKRSKGALAEYEAAMSMGHNVINKTWLQWYVEEIRKREEKRPEPLEIYCRGDEKKKKFLNGEESRKELAPL